MSHFRTMHDDYGVPFAMVNTLTAALIVSENEDEFLACLRCQDRLSGNPSGYHLQYVLRWCEPYYLSTYGNLEFYFQDLKMEASKWIKHQAHNKLLKNP